MPITDLLAARISVLIVFFAHGAVISTWISRIPAVQAALNLSTGILGFALLGIGVGSIVSMPIAGWMISRYGSKPVTIYSSLWFCLTLLPLSLSNSAVTLALSLCLLGLAAGAMDVSMNAQGVIVERLARKPMMSGFHAAFSIGGMTGAALGGLIAKAGVGVGQHFVFAAFLFLTMVICVLRGLVPAGAERAPEHKEFRLSPVILGLGAICFCFFLSEGAIADWSALYLMRGLRAGPAQAAAGYALFSGAMAIGRFVGDPLRARFGPVFLVRIGSLLAAFGLAVALVFGQIWVALVGFTLVGFGCSIIVPIAFAAAGNQTGSAGSALAAVVTLGYCGLFAGPPLIGMVAEWMTLRWALFIVVGLCLVGTVLARVVAERKP